MISNNEVSKDMTKIVGSTPAINAQRGIFLMANIKSTLVALDSILIAYD